MSNNCIIELLDHKNMKLHGLDPQTRRKCTERLKYQIPNARYIPSVKLGRWDGTVSLCTIGGNTYINLLPDLYPIILDANYDISIKDNRPNNNYKLEHIDENYLSYALWNSGQFEGEPIILRDHQVNAINALIDNDCGTIVAATSSGKTIICGALCKMTEEFGRTITIVPNRDLVDQTYDDYVMLGLDAGKIYHGSRELDKQHTITTWQSLHAIKKNSKDQLTDKEIEKVTDGVILTLQDETHLAAAKAIFEINSKILKDVPRTYGMTGTIPKEEHLRETIRANFGEVVYKVPAHELQEKGILAKCEIELNQIIYDESFTDYQTEKKKVNNDQRVIDIIADDVIRLTQSTELSNTLVLVENIDTGLMLEEAIPNSIFLSGSVKSKKRKEEYKTVSTENAKVIIATYGIASTGISINRLFNLVLFNPGKSFTRVIQSIGRGLRVAEDKDFVNIVDYSLTTKYSKRHLTERKRFYKESNYPFVMKKRSIE